MTVFFTRTSSVQDLLVIMNSLAEFWQSNGLFRELSILYDRFLLSELALKMYGGHL